MSDALEDPMKAEFDTVAHWTAEVALSLGPEYYVPAGCRGSGSPSSLRWLIDRLALSSDDRMLDCGAGVGGPAAFAAQESGVAPILSEPEAGACRAAQRLFGFPVVRAASELPFADASFDVAWSLGVLCTVPDQPHLLSELHRVLRPDGRLGLLVFVARSLPLPDQPVGNDFPTEPQLRALLGDAHLQIVNSATMSDFAASTDLWQDRADAVEAELERRHSDEPLWQTAVRQSQLIGSLLAKGELFGMLVVARPVRPALNRR
jgi:ubiquinone/menaquinone biosynthesis C-methylase UbiE